MIRVCSACRKVIGRDSHEPAEALTHGLCRQCAHEMLAEYGIPDLDQIEVESAERVPPRLIGPLHLGATA